MHLADWVPTLLGLAGVKPPTGENILSNYSVTRLVQIGTVVKLVIGDIGDDGHVDDNEGEWSGPMGFRTR